MKKKIDYKKSHPKKDILDKLTCAKVLSNSYNKVLVEEKKKILEFFENLIENLDEKTFSNYKKDEISEAIKLMNVILFKNNPKINDNLNFLYVKVRVFNNMKHLFSIIL